MHSPLQGSKHKLAQHQRDSPGPGPGSESARTRKYLSPDPSDDARSPLSSSSSGHAAAGWWWRVLGHMWGGGVGQSGSPRRWQQLLRQAQQQDAPSALRWLRVLVAVSLAFNLLALCLWLRGLVRIDTRASLHTLVFGLKRPRFIDQPRPNNYSLFEHISTFQAEHVLPTCVNQSFLMPPQFRDDLGRLLESLGGFKRGVELGVQAGVFSATMLKTWPSCERYYLVDLWGQQTNYNDNANVEDQEQLKIMEEAQRRLEPWANKTVFVRSLTTKAVAAVPGMVDFVYVDARHDFCGVWADLVAWWPKVRPGGIIAGHDYRGAAAVWPHSDWSLCESGERHHGAVMGAVNEWAMMHGLQVLATWGRAEWSSWIIRKPYHVGACGKLGLGSRPLPGSWRGAGSRRQRRSGVLGRLGGSSEGLGDSAWRAEQLDT